MAGRVLDKLWALPPLVAGSSIKDQDGQGVDPRHTMGPCQERPPSRSKTKGQRSGRGRGEVVRGLARAARVLRHNGCASCKRERRSAAW